MSENSAYTKLKSLQAKGCLKIVGTERGGTRIRLYLPSEIEGILDTTHAIEEIDIEGMDFFAVPQNRILIFEREGGRCFYCLRLLTESSRLIEHIDSRPRGTNSYRNVVAACTSCNNRKCSLPAEDFIRQLYRDGYLNDAEFQGRLIILIGVREGTIKPTIKM